MKTPNKQTLHVCGRCKRSLTADNFYISKTTGLPGNYCKECRKAANRDSRENEKYALICDKREDYPVITRTEDPVLRRELILKALRTVANSIERKKQKLQEAECEQAD